MNLRLYQKNIKPKGNKGSVGVRRFTFPCQGSVIVQTRGDSNRLDSAWDIRESGTAEGAREQNYAEKTFSRQRKEDCWNRKAWNKV